jgi:hypothetical protein
MLLEVCESSLKKQILGAVTASKRMNIRTVAKFHGIASAICHFCQQFENLSDA